MPCRSALRKSSRVRTEKVYTPDIINGPGKLYKRPGYKPF
jgi:hypothetical protein